MATEKEYLISVQKSIERELEANIDALPKGFENKRFALNCIALIKDNMAKWQEDYKNVDYGSVITAFIKGAFLDLDFFNKECYIIPYKNEATFQTDYKGEIKLAKKYSKRPIKDIFAKNVKEGDIFSEMIVDGQHTIKYQPKPFNDNEIIGTFAVILFEDGGISCETMSKKEIEKIRTTSSKAPNSPAWKNYPGEMYKKTVLRRLLKTVDLHFDNTTQQSAFQGASDFDPNKEVVIDVADEVRDPLANMQRDKASKVQNDEADKEETSQDVSDKEQETVDGTSTTQEEAEQVNITDFM